MGLVGLGLRFHGSVAHILHRQSTGNDQYFVKRLSVSRFQNHSTHARVQWQSGQLSASRRELIGVVHRTQFRQQLIAIGNGAFRRGLNEWKVIHHAQVQGLHSQDDAGQRRTQNFGVGKFGS